MSFESAKLFVRAALRAKPIPSKQKLRGSVPIAHSQVVPKVVQAGHKLSIAVDSKEASVSNATIHNRHPDIAEKTRKLLSGSYFEQLVTNHAT